MRGLIFNDKKRVCYFAKKGDNQSFYESLKMLYEEIKKEWIGQGNKEKYFASSGIKIIIILDNTSSHKKKEMLATVEANLPNIIFYFLHPYSPDYNLIELVWHSAKEYLAHRLFQSVDELRNLLDKLLNQGELIIKWNIKLKNKGNSIIGS